MQEPRSQDLPLSQLPEPGTRPSLLSKGMQELQVPLAHAGVKACRSRCLLT